MIGLSNKKVKLVGYSEDWAGLYQTEADNLKRLLKDNVVSIQHVGSTSIPNMMFAKPIIDIAVGIETIEQLGKVKEILLANDYYYNENAGDTDRWFFAKGKAENRMFNIHVELIEGVSWNNHINFKNFMIKHPEYVSKYCDVKKELASRYRDDRLKYTEGKAEFIQSVLKMEDRDKEIEVKL